MLNTIFSIGLSFSVAVFPVCLCLSLFVPFVCPLCHYFLLLAIRNGLQNSSGIVEAFWLDYLGLSATQPVGN